MPFSSAHGDDLATSQWEARAVARSLAPARARSEDQARALVDAARELVAERADLEFTVSDVVERAGSSLKAFYRLFEAKQDLLLAIFEEDNRVGARRLGALVAAESEQPARLRAAVVGLFGFVDDKQARPYMAVLVREHLRLAESRPGELRRALAPYIDVLDAELADAADRGAIRAPGQRDADTLMHLILGHLQSLILVGDGDDAADVAAYVWDFASRGLALEGEKP